SVWVAVRVFDGVRVGVVVAVAVAVRVGNGVRVDVGVAVGVRVLVGVRVPVCVRVEDGVGVLERVRVPLPDGGGGVIVVGAGEVCVGVLTPTVPVRVGVKVMHCPVPPEQLALNTGMPPLGQAPSLGGPQNGPN